MERASLRLTAYFVLLLLAWLFVVEVATYYDATVPAALQGTLIAAEMSMTSILVAVMAFQYQTFWNDTKVADEPNPKPGTNIDMLHAVAKNARKTFVVLLTATVLVAISLIIELVGTLFEKTAIPQSVPIGSLFMGIALLMIFVLMFFGGTVVAIERLYEASTNSGAIQSAPAKESVLPRAK
jgi:hypothetical protein